MNLDFDVAYQYSIAKYYGLKIVTMDKDFERIKDIEVMFPQHFLKCYFHFKYKFQNKFL